MSFFYHEQLHRSADVWARVKAMRVTICGAGALGANICENLARAGFENLRVIDRDRVEERNLSTQPFFRSDIGAQKAKILANSIYRAVGTKVEAVTQELNVDNATKLLDGIVLDCFDNSKSRQTIKDVCATKNLECLHIGLAHGYAELVWNAVYRVPSDAQDDVCDYPLARNLVMLAAAVGAELLIRFAATGEQANLCLTFNDLSISQLNF